MVRIQASLPLRLEDWDKSLNSNIRYAWITGYYYDKIFQRFYFYVTIDYQL